MNNRTIGNTDKISQHLINKLKEKMFYINKIVSLERAPQEIAKLKDLYDLYEGKFTEEVNNPFIKKGLSNQIKEDLTYKYDIIDKDSL